MKRTLRKILVRWLFKKQIRHYKTTINLYAGNESSGYLQDLLWRDECRMVGSKEGLLGYYDTDIEINRMFQEKIRAI